MNETQTKNTGKGRSYENNGGVSAAKNAVNNLVKGSYNKHARKNGNGGRRKTPPKDISPIRIIPLGGLGEIGKNITLYEFSGDMIIVDCGMSFPDEEMPGIDAVIPDFTYIVENKEKIKGRYSSAVYFPSK